jgi:hypothetical protein
LGEGDEALQRQGVREGCTGKENVQESRRLIGESVPILYDTAHLFPTSLVNKVIMLLFLRLLVCIFCLVQKKAEFR